jgi:hypothetical protein
MTLHRSRTKRTGASAPTKDLGVGTGGARHTGERHPRGVLGDLVDGQARSGAGVPLGGPALPDGRSLLDLFRGRFTLLNLAPDADSGALLEAFQSRGIPIDVEWVAVDRARVTYRNTIALVRPDGIVAWRGDTCPVGPDLVVDQVTGRIRSRQC